MSRIWGDAAEPVEYVYDDLNRILEIRTFRQGSDWNSESWPDNPGPADAVRFHYDSKTGLLTSKEYPDGATESWTYTAAGRIASRTWARAHEDAPLTTTYIRDPATAEIVRIDYSDDTPDLTISYDRLGRPATAKWNSEEGRPIMAEYKYDETDLKLESETVKNLYPSERRIARSYSSSSDSEKPIYLGMYKGFDLEGVYENAYGFDKYGRVDSVEFSLEIDPETTLSDKFQYEFLDVPKPVRPISSNLVEKITAGKDLSRRIAWHPNADLPESIENSFGERTISRYDLERDALWRIIEIQKSGEAEAEAMAQKAALARQRGDEWLQSPLYLDDGAVDVAPERREYSYDNAGNRLQAIEWLDTLETLTYTYATNMLNQYTTINEDDGAGTIAIGLSHDEDGNLSSISDGTKIQYEYDAENRLKRVLPENPSDGDIKVEFHYDWLGRRVKKSVYKWNSEAWETEAEYEKFFVYDGYNAIEEITSKDGKTASKYYVRGLDLSGTTDGAGGIGGLLATVDPESSKVYYHLYGPNGNTAQLLSDNGRIAAHYEYDPFGNVQFQYGPLADQNPFRFSTKYFDEETGLGYWRDRYYDPYIGRWTNRDPIGEAGGLNLYGFVGNDPINLVDPYGDMSGGDVLFWTGWIGSFIEPTPFGESSMVAITAARAGALAIELENKRNAYLNEKEGSGSDNQCDSSEEGGSSGNPDPDDENKEEREGPNSTVKNYSHTEVGGRSAITDGKYTTDPVGMARHKPGTAPNNKSVFRSDVDAEQATLDAARYADENNLWNAQNKAKVPVSNGTVGYLSDGTPTQTVNVYRRKSGSGYLIHGTPGSN